MKNNLKIFTIIFSLLSLTQLNIADIELQEQSSKVANNNPKKLVVESNATKIGENSSSEIKTRAIRMEIQDDNSQNKANVNVGKLEFYVK